MDSEKKEEVVVIGSGCAGLSAAIYAARAMLNPIVIEGQLPGGQLTQTTEVENFPGFPEGIQGFELTNRMRAQAEKFGAKIISGEVVAIEKLSDCRAKKITLSGGKTILAEAVIIATGTFPKRLNVKGEHELFGGKGISACATCDGFFFRNEDVCVIGGGDSACEEAIYLSKICKKVYLIHRRDELRASKIMVDRVVSNDKIEVLWSSIPEEFIADENGYLCSIKLANKATNTSTTISCKGAFLAIGWRPNTNHFAQALELDEDGYIKVLNNSLSTSIDGVFAAGDCVDKKYQQASVAAGMGVQAALEAERWLLEA